MYQWLRHSFNALSQMGNALLLGGHSNESISGRAYRENWALAVKIINGIFFWQSHHCRGAYNADRKWATEYLQTEVKR